MKKTRPAKPSVIPMLVLGILITCLSVTCRCQPGTYTLDVQRHFDTPDEEGLIQIAESVYPPRDDIIAYLGGDSPELPQEHLWWYDSFDGILIPYAITTEAIEYYTQIVLDLKDEYENVPCNWRNPQPSSNFAYQANIAYHDTYQNGGDTFTAVYVVTMHLTWGSQCGPLCGLYFDKDRTVVLTAEGEVLVVYGDGPTDIIVS